MGVTEGANDGTLLGTADGRLLGKLVGYDIGDFGEFFEVCLVEPLVTVWRVPFGFDLNMALPLPSNNSEDVGDKEIFFDIDDFTDDDLGEVASSKHLLPFPLEGASCLMLVFDLPFTGVSNRRRRSCPRAPPRWAWSRGNSAGRPYLFCHSLPSTNCAGKQTRRKKEGKEISWLGK